MKISLLPLKICILIIFISHSVFAQTDTTLVKSDSLDNDSINTVLLEEYNLALAKIEQQRLNDSIQRAELEEQLNSLKTTDNLKKEELQKKIQLIEEKELKRLAQKRAQIDSLKHTIIGYPVLGFFEDTLFTIYSKLGSLSAKDRAEVITKRINGLGDIYGFKPDTLKIIEVENLTDIIFDVDIVMSVSENDALFNDTTRTELAQKYKVIISDEVIRYQTEISFTELAKEIGLALLVILVTWIIIVYTNRFFNWLIIKIKEQENKLIKGIKIKNYTLFDSKRQVNTLLTINGVLRWLIVLMIIYIALPILFGIFPWTQNFAETLFGYILNPLRSIFRGFLDYLPNLITIIVILVVFRYVLKGIYFLRTEIALGKLHIPGFYPDWANPTYQIIRVLIFAFMIVVIFPYLPGSDSPIFKGVSVFLGFLFTFGSAGSLSNIIAGIMLTYMRAFKINDRVKVGDVTGDVVEKTVLATRIRTIKNEIISIPNSTVMNSQTTNYSSDAPDKGLIIHTTVTIGYDVPWRKMHEALVEAALRTELILKEPEPFVLQTSLEDFYVAYQINAYIREANKQAVIYSNLHQNIQDVCNEKGIEILSPHYRAARDGNMITIPADYLPKDYKIPGFNLFVNNDKKDPSK